MDRNRNDNSIPNAKEEKGKFYDSDLFLNRILKWTIFYGAGNRLAQKTSSYVKSQYYVEAYDVLWSVLSCSNISCAGDRLAQKMSLYVEL